MAFGKKRQLFAIASVFSVAFASRAFGYGEPGDKGAPSHEERLLHVLTNQVRQAPHDWPGTQGIHPDTSSPKQMGRSLRRKVEYPSTARATIGSPARLNEVLSRTGTPVRAP